MVVLIGVLSAVPVLLASATRLAPPLVEAVTTTLAGSLTQPFAVAALTLMYFDMRPRPAPEPEPDGDPETQTEEESANDDLSTD
jgi:hypothetical protein